jgi:hypothetical protein
MLKQLSLALTPAVLASSAALAHHSPSAYDMSRQVAVQGTLTKVDWANPHIYLTIETTGADGQRTTQQVESVSIAVAQATGFTRDVLTLGTNVVVNGHPNRRGAGYTVLGEDITTSDGNIYPLRGSGRNSRPPAATVPAAGLAGKWAPKGNPQLMNIVWGWPLTDKARAALAALRAGSVQITVGCDALPLPMLTQLPLLRTIDVRDDRVVMTVDSDGVDAARIVHLDLAEHPGSIEPSLYGHSIGRFQGDTLVIDTVAFTPHEIGIGFGIPSGPGKHMTERLTLAADRLQVLYELTIEDPEYLSAAASYTAMWDHRPDLAPSGTGCDPEISERFRQE